MEKSTSTDIVTASVTRGANQSNQMEAHGRYVATCLDSEGNLKWVEEFDNLVTTQGKDFLLNTTMIAGSAGTGALASVNMFFRMGFVNSNTAALATFTYAVHVFTEIANTVIATRGSPQFSASASGVKSTSAAVNATIAGAGGTIYGVSLNLLNAAAVGNLGVVSDTATANAILYSYGLFGAGKVVSSGDQLNVTYSTTLS